MSVWAIVVAGGGGSRFGAAKQFARLGGATVLDRAVATAREACDGSVVVLPPDTDVDRARRDRHRSRAARRARTRCGPVSTACPTTPRSSSCTMRRARSRRARCSRQSSPRSAPASDAAIPALPVVDTVKRVDGDRVVATVPRDDLVVVQTPQAFRAAAAARRPRW